MANEEEKHIFKKYFSDNQTDHLSYLKWDFSIFENKADGVLLQKNLVCAACGHPITKVFEKIEVRGRHDYGFTNLGYLVRLGCFRNAPGCIGVETISNGYSWFRGYSWQIQLCQNCFTQMGWKYMSGNDSFYGLVFRMLQEEAEKCGG